MVSKEWTFLQVCISFVHRFIIVLFDWGRKWPPLGSGNTYIEFYKSNNNVCQFLQLFNILMLFIETINYKTGPCVIRRSINDFENMALFSINVDLGTCRQSPKEMKLA